MTITYNNYWSMDLCTIHCDNFVKILLVVRIEIK